MGPQLDNACRDALIEVKRVASEIVGHTTAPYDGARQIASKLGDCYSFMNKDIPAVDILAAIAGKADEYDENSNQPAITRDVEAEIIATANKFLQAATSMKL